MSKIFPASKRAIFVTAEAPDKLVQQERNRRPWMRHSVVLLILSPRVNELALVQPQKALDRDGEHVVVPPQCSLEMGDNVVGAAIQISEDVLNVPIHPDRFMYFGSGRGNSYGSGVLKPYSKWVHFVAVHIRGNKSVLNRSSHGFVRPQWHGVKSLESMGMYAMTRRKHEMIMQALASFDNSGKLVEMAQAKINATSATRTQAA
jgi:hypothetical protein